MIARAATLLTAFALLSACGTATPPPAAAPKLAAEPIPPAHQSQEKPKLPTRQASPGNGGNKAGTKTGLTFDVPPAWVQAPASAVRKPWILGLVNPEQHSQVLVEFNVRSQETAAEATKAVVESVCEANGWQCTAPQPLPSGDGASFTFTTAKKTKGKIAFRDLDGAGRCQLQLFGTWPKDSEAEASKDFDTMLATAKVK